MAKKGQAERRAQKREQKETQDGANEKCDIPECLNKGFTQSCCQKKLCGACMLSLHHYCECDKRFLWKCPFCRNCFCTQHNDIKRLMAYECPSRAKVFDGCHESKFTITHLPCDEGCYDCEKSRLVIQQVECRRCR